MSMSRYSKPPLSHLTRSLDAAGRFHVIQPSPVHYGVDEIAATRRNHQREIYLIAALLALLIGLFLYFSVYAPALHKAPMYWPVGICSRL